MSTYTSDRTSNSIKRDPMADHREIELKLEIPLEGLRKLEQSQLLRNESAKGADVVSIYFDTGKLNLRKNGVSLRVRQIGERRLQTVKRDEPGIGDALGRDEWETEIDGETPDLEAARRTVLEPVLTKKVRRTLKPVFETRVHRTVYPIRYDGSEIEVSVDEGSIEAGRRSSSLLEVELELRHGDASALFGLARQIAKDVPVALGVKSKAERGYELLAGESSRAVRAFSVKLTAKQTPQSAFQAIARACLRQLCANTGPLREGDAEGLHQGRVAIRRLRVAISLFSDLLRDEQTDGIKRELKWLTGEFGPAREADVFMEGAVKPVAEADPKTPGAGELKDNAAKHRKAQFARAQSAVDTARFRALALEVATWIETGDWTRADRGQSDKGTIADTAAEQLNRRWKKLVKGGKHIDELDARQRHKLRIAAKKLRYASEFFVDVFPGKRGARRRKRFLSDLKALQTCLGDLNDVAVNRRLSASFVSDPAARQGRDGRVRQAFAAGTLYGREERRFSSAMKAATRAYETFAGAKRFWN